MALQPASSPLAPSPGDFTVPNTPDVPKQPETPDNIRPISSPPPIVKNRLYRIQVIDALPDGKHLCLLIKKIVNLAKMLAPQIKDSTLREVALTAALDAGLTETAKWITRSISNPIAAEAVITEFTHRIHQRQLEWDPQTQMLRSPAPSPSTFSVPGTPAASEFQTTPKPDIRRIKQTLPSLENPPIGNLRAEGKMDELPNEKQTQDFVTKIIKTFQELKPPYSNAFLEMLSNIFYEEKLEFTASWIADSISIPEIRKNVLEKLEQQRQERYVAECAHRGLTPGQAYQIDLLEAYSCQQQMAVQALIAHQEAAIHLFQQEQVAQETLKEQVVQILSQQHQIVNDLLEQQRKNQRFFREISQTILQQEFVLLSQQRITLDLSQSQKTILNHLQQLAEPLTQQVAANIFVTHKDKAQVLLLFQQTGQMLPEFQPQ